MNKTIWETLIRGDVQVGGDPGGSPTGSSYKVGEKLDRDAIMTCKGGLNVVSVMWKGPEEWKVSGRQ
jgi:hypothetical protein